MYLGKMEEIYPVYFYTALREPIPRPSPPSHPLPPTTASRKVSSRRLTTHRSSRSALMISDPTSVPTK